MWYINNKVNAEKMINLILFIFEQITNLFVYLFVINDNL
jgi:hypothetical protein